jgi:hypothetical protein
MERDDVAAQVHEVLTHALYHHTHLFYSRHLDTLLLAALYGYCKVNRLQQVRRSTLCCEAWHVDNTVTWLVPPALPVVQRLVRGRCHVTVMCMFYTTHNRQQACKPCMPSPAALTTAAAHKLTWHLYVI